MMMDKEVTKRQFMSFETLALVFGALALRRGE